MKLILRFIVLTITIFFLSKILTGFAITSNQPIKTALIASLVLTLLNIFIKPLIKLFTLPINLLTLGFFSIFINAFLLWVVVWYVDGFGVTNFLTVIFASLIISVVNFAFGYK